MASLCTDYKFNPRESKALINGLDYFTTDPHIRSTQLLRRRDELKSSEETEQAHVSSPVHDVNVHARYKRKCSLRFTVCLEPYP